MIKGTKSSTKRIIVQLSGINVKYTLLFANSKPTPSRHTCKRPPSPVAKSCTGNSPPSSGAVPAVITKRIHQIHIRAAELLSR